MTADRGVGSAGLVTERSTGKLVTLLIRYFGFRFFFGFLPRKETVLKRSIPKHVSAYFFQSVFGHTKNEFLCSGT